MHRSVFVAGVGYFELTVNGKRVGAGRKFDVGWTEYAKRVFYVNFNLTSFLSVGENVVGVELGNSWYQENGWYQQPPYMGCNTKAQPGRHGQGSGTCNGGGFSYPNANQLLLKANIKLMNGSVMSLHTDGGGDWLSAAGPITFDSLYDGEHYDARLEQPGWNSVVGYNPSVGGWIAAQAVAPTDNVMSKAVLSSQPYEPIRVVAEETPHASWTWNGSYIFDYGRNMVGVVRLRISNPVAGATVTLRHAEVKMHPPYGEADGSLYYGSLRNVHATDKYYLHFMNTWLVISKMTGVSTYDSNMFLNSDRNII